MEPLGNTVNNQNDTKIFRQQHPWSVRYGPTSLLHVLFHTRACYSHVKIPDKLVRWNGDELEVEKYRGKFGQLSTYTQYSRHLDDTDVEDRAVDYDDREFDIYNMTYTYRLDPDSYKLNCKPFLALRPEYCDRSKRVILL